MVWPHDQGGWTLKILRCYGRALDLLTYSIYIFVSLTRLFLDLYTAHSDVGGTEVEIFSKFFTLLVFLIDYISLCYFIGFPRNQTLWFVTVGDVQNISASPCTTKNIELECRNISPSWMNDAICDERIRRYQICLHPLMLLLPNFSMILLPEGKEVASRHIYKLSFTAVDF